MTARAARDPAAQTAILVLALAILSSPAAAAAPIEADIAGGHLTLPVPAGYCTIDRSVEVQRELGERIARVMSQRDVYLGIAIDCAELAALEDAPGRGFTTYLIWIAEGDGSGKAALYPDAGRGDFVAAAADQGAAVDSDEVSQEATDLWRQELDNDAIEVEALELGAAGYDGNAYYATGLARVGGADSDLSLATMALGTLIHGIHVQAFLYRPFAGERSFDALELEAAALAAALIAANPDSDPAASGLGDRGLSMLRGAVIGGLLGALVAGAIWLLGRLRRPPGRHLD